MILAHNNWQQLYRLIHILDSENASFYIHIDKKSRGFDINEFKNVCKYSKVSFFSNYKCFWGSYSLVQSELFLISQALADNCDYYHLLSGADMPIKSKNYIENFFEKNSGKEFIHFDTDLRLMCDKEISRRTKLYHWLQDYRHRYKSRAFNEFFTAIEHCSLGVQLLLGVDRLAKEDIKIYYGSQWFSITKQFAKYALEKVDYIEKIFSNTSCSDELVFQTLIMQSKFKNHLYIMERNNSCLSNMRLIDWKRGKNGSPYTWQAKDINELKQSPCLFARKFQFDFPEELIEQIIGCENHYT